MAPSFSLTPETEASLVQFYKRQFFTKIPALSRRDVDLTGKTALVTGSNVGLGLESARQFLDLGCSKVILAVRSEAKGEEARKDLLQGRNLKPGAVEVWKLDLGSYDSIVALADRAKKLPRLDLVILNAGIFKSNEAFSAKTGYEDDIQVNYLSNMLLIILISPILAAKKQGNTPGRIVLVNSDMAAWSKFTERTSSPILPAFRQKMAKWDMNERYSTSKLLGQLFLLELTRRVPASSVVVACCNPGMCYGSAISSDLNPVARAVFWIIQHIVGRSCAVGSRIYLHAAVTLGDEVHGQYVEDKTIHP